MSSLPFPIPQAPGTSCLQTSSPPTKHREPRLCESRFTIHLHAAELRTSRFDPKRPSLSKWHLALHPLRPLPTLPQHPC